MKLCLRSSASTRGSEAAPGQRIDPAVPPEPLSAWRCGTGATFPTLTQLQGKTTANPWAETTRDPIYRRRRFSAETIELCVRWYITYRLSYRDLAAMMAEREIVVSPTTVM